MSSRDRLYETLKRAARDVGSALWSSMGSVCTELQRLAIFLGLEDEKALEIGRICKETATRKIP
jgi:hypothetical protein